MVTSSTRLVQNLRSKAHQEVFIYRSVNAHAKLVSEVQNQTCHGRKQSISSFTAFHIHGSVQAILGVLAFNPALCMCLWWSLVLVTSDVQEGVTMVLCGCDTHYTTLQHEGHFWRSSAKERHFQRRNKRPIAPPTLGRRPVLCLALASTPHSRSCMILFALSLVV